MDREISHEDDDGWTIKHYTHTHARSRWNRKESS